MDRRTQGSGLDPIGTDMAFRRARIDSKESLGVHGFHLAQLFSGTNEFSLFLVAAPLKRCFPQKRVPFFSPGSLN